MLRFLRSAFRLVVIILTLARHDALAVLEEARIAPGLVALARLVLRRRKVGRAGEKLARALTELGPSFIKLGQFLSTRADLLGERLAADLAELQDNLPPFPAEQARAVVAEEFGQPLEELFSLFDDEPVSAASIAQVHYAVTTGGEPVAVKILRPGVERAIRRDLDLFYWLAGLAVRAEPRLRRFKPVEVVKLFEDQVRLEMDLRMEAAAASELARNFEGDPTYRVPPIDWERTGQRVMTQGRLTGIPIDDRAALLAAGHDLTLILSKAAAIFFNQVFRDGFFHGDQHPGNMFVDAEGNIGAVDFGIMGRLDHRTKVVLADMLLALLDRNYRRLAQVQVEAGYLSDSLSIDLFAQALRSVCEPIFGQPLEKISFGRLLGQLFQLAESFDMEVQPQLLLLQKNMMMAEGVSRRLDPSLNIWTLAEPLIEAWVVANRGPAARLRDARQEAERLLERLPHIVAEGEAAVRSLGEGVKIHPESLRELRYRTGRRTARIALWISLIALGIAIAAMVE
jgi:ubiquinone biosynthesis protein